MKFIHLLIAILTCLPLAGTSQEMDTKKLDQYMNALDGKFMGSIHVLKNGKTIYHKNLGYTDISTRKKADESTKYRIGSISKTFTAALVFKAVEEKKISLEKTIIDYFPTIKNAEKITISHLLNHRSGIHSFTNDEDYLGWHTLQKSEQEMISIIARGDSKFEPGSKAEYSNSNYVLLTYILEKAYQKPFSTILAEKIVEPLGLKNTSVGKKINAQNNESFSYKLTNTWEIEKETDMSIPMGAGAVISTPGDLTRFADALFNGKIISKDSLATMITIKDNYGMGIFQMPFYNKQGFGHSGGIDGFTSVFSYFPEDKIAYALTSNGSSYTINNISLAVLSSVYNKPFDIPDFKTISLTSDELNPYLGIYSSDQIPLKITITKNGNTLVAQATGQSSFELDATEKHIFKFDQAGIVLIFTPDKNQMTLKQGGGVFEFTKNKEI